MMKRVPFLLAIAIAFCPPILSAKDRAGAAAAVIRTDGSERRGELYGVSDESLTIVDAQGRSETIELREVREIRLKKRTGRSVRTGAIIGSLAISALLVTQAAANSDGGGSPQGEEILALSGLVVLGGAVPGGFVGWLAGGASKTKTVRIEGVSGEALRRALVKLRKSARLRSVPAPHA